MTRPRPERPAEPPPEPQQPYLASAFSWGSVSRSMSRELSEGHSKEDSLVWRLQQEVDRLRTENSSLKFQVAQLQSAIETLEFIPEKLVEQARLGPAALKYAPRDLYIVYSIKFAECVAYYGFAYIYVSFLSEELNFTDEEAGDLYSVYGLLCTVVGLQMGYVIDRLGVRRSAMIGTVASFFARFLSLVTYSKWWACLISLTFFPVGAAFGVPVLALGVRRYTHEENRGFAFSFFYACLCLACLIGSVIINRIRAYCLEPVTWFGVEWTWLRVVLFACVLFTVYTVPASCCLRDIQVLSDRPLKEQACCDYRPKEGTLVDATKEVIGQRRFWRLVAVTLIFCGVRMTFRHLDATFPKYFTRTFGPQAPFELILCINPIVTMVATPIVTGLLLKYKVRYDKSLIGGAFVSGLSMFCLAAWESFSGAILFVCLLSLGEAIWSPKLYEFSTMSAPEGREGMYVAITMAPMYLASVPVGTLSGWALNRWVPKEVGVEGRHGQLMWFILGLIGFSSPVLLWAFRNRLFKAGDDKPPEEEEEQPSKAGKMGLRTKLSAQEDDDDDAAASAATPAAAARAAPAAAEDKRRHHHHRHHHHHHQVKSQKIGRPTDLSRDDLGAADKA